MDNRKWEADAAAAPPSAPASPSNGYPTNGNALTATPATEPGEWLWYSMTEEMRNVILDGGLTPDINSLTQVRDAIRNMIKGGDYKPSVRVASTLAINLAAPGANIDGVAMVAGDRFLEKDHGTPALRGIYIWNGAAVPATRALDADDGAEFNGGAIIPVEEGTVNADTNWQLTNDGAVIIGTTALTFVQIAPTLSQVLPGTGIDWYGPTAPAGYLVCPLSLTYVNATTYSPLAFAIGTTHGNGGATVAAGAFGVGNTYVIKTVGTTDFTLIGAASNTVGLTFKATGVGAGTGIANSEIALPWYPADYASVQANANVGTQTVGAVIGHVHLQTGFNVGGGGVGTLVQTGPITYGAPANTASTGGAANLAAGVRVLKCVKY